MSRLVRFLVPGPVSGPGFGPGSGPVSGLVSGLVLVLALLSGVARAEAEPLPTPSGPIILEVDGKIDKTNAGDRAVFDLDLLERLGVTTLTTETPWTEGRVVFEGVSGPALLQAVGAEGETVTATALNDYMVEIPLSDFREAGLLVAYRLDGAPMSVRDKGPLWIVFPFSARPELAGMPYEARSVWQLKRLTFK